MLATNAYVLLTSDYFPFSKTQCAVFRGRDRAVFLDKREFTGPIYTQIEEAVDFVLRNIRLGATIDGLVRRERYELPPEAIREMIINLTAIGICWMNPAYRGRYMMTALR